MSDISKKIDSIEKLAKEAERLAKNLQTNPFLEFDRIAKDIQEQKDNAMAMEFTKCIGELLKKNGVVPKITEYTRNFETDNTFETRYGVSIDELDFSEHDKVFEDKIASLEENVGYYKDSISRVEKNCDKLYHENKELKQITKGYEDKIAKLEKTVECYKQALIYKCSNFDSQSKILEKFATENESLKQRIAELESKNNQLTESILRKETKIHELESKETETVSDIDTSNPLACAESLIEHMTHLEKYMIMLERDVQTFSVEELKEIADYLMVYYRHHRDRDAEETISF